jgi:hypothetical protein
VSPPWSSEMRKTDDLTSGLGDLESSLFDFALCTQIAGLYMHFYMGSGTYFSVG